MNDFKVKCVRNYGGCHTIGKIYDVVSGYLDTDRPDIRFSCGTYTNINIINNDLASQFELVEENKMFKKEDLKVGHLVKYRDGRLRVLTEIQGGLVFTGGLCLSEFSDDLKNKHESHSDIVEVYGFTKMPKNFLDESIDNRRLLWMREIPIIELTLNDIANKFDIPVKLIRIKER